MAGLTDTIDTSYASTFIANNLKEREEKQTFCDKHILSLVPAFTKNIIEHMKKNQKCTHLLILQNYFQQ